MGRKFSRRTFLKLSGMTAGTIAFSGCSLPKTMSTTTDASDLESKYVRSYCEMCTSRCPIEVKVAAGKAVLVSGNPDWAATGGTVCARGGAGISQLYDEQRLQKPLIRSGERGEGKWQEVSWDEAYQYIAAKMNDIKTQYGPEAMAFACRGGPHKAYMDTLAKAYGSPNTFSHESTCPMARTVAQEATLGTSAVAIDYANVKYLVSLGRSYFEGINVAQTRGVVNAINKGGKLISLDPRFSLTAAKADEWYPIKPGTDLAFVLAIIHVLIRDNLYNKEFVDKYTDGLDEVVTAVAATTPAWAEGETGIKAADIEKIAQGLAAAKPQAVVDPGWRTTSTPEEFQLRRATMIATLLLGSFEVPGGMYLVKSASLINSLVGKNVVQNLEGFKLPPFPQPARPRIDGASVKGQPNYMVPTSDGVVQTIPEAIITGQPYPLKGWFVLRYNPVISQSDTNRVIEALKKLDLLVVSDIYMSDTAWYADVVLPESTYLERDEAFNNNSGTVPVYTLRQQVVPPVYETKPHWQIFKELSAKMGLENYFPWQDIEEVRLAQLGGRQDLLKTAKEKGVVAFGLKPLFLRDKSSVAQFVAMYPEAQVAVNDEGIIDQPFSNLHTPTKRIALFSSEAEELFGRGVPVYRPVNLKADNQLYYIQGKTAIHTNAHTHNVPWLYNLMPVNRLWVNPETAAKLGLEDDCDVEITSAQGNQQAKVLVSKGVRPDTVFTYFGFGRLSPGLKRAYKQGINANILLPNFISPVAGSVLHTNGVELKKM